MELSLLLKGIITGIIISAPIGPVGALCVQRTMSEGRLSGIVSGFGASVGDTVFAVIAAFGLTFISDLLYRHERWFHIVGGVILLIFGLRVYFSKAPECKQDVENINRLGRFSSALILTLSNPLVILSIIAVYAILGITKPAAYYPSTALLVIGVFIGCVLMWMLLCNFLEGYRERMSTRGLSIVNRISGFFILACAAYAFMSLL